LGVGPADANDSCARRHMKSQRA